MRFFLGTRDRKIALFVAALVVFVFAYWGLMALVAEHYVTSPEPSSVYTSEYPWGLYVYYRYLDELGVGTDTWERFDELPDAGATLVAAGPFSREPTHEEAALVARWVERGGRLVLVGHEAQSLGRDLEVSGGGVEGWGLVPVPSFVETGSEPDRMTPRLPSVYTRDVGSIVLDGARLLVEDPRWVAHFKDIDGQALLSRTVGEGEVVWLASTYPLANGGIGEADNAELGVVLAAAAGGPVYFDEYHHGYVSGGGLWDKIGAGGRASTVLVVAALVLAGLAAVRRLGPPVPEPDVPTARTGAYVGSLAELYRRAGARAEALETLEDGLGRSLAARYGTLAAGLARHPEAARALDASRAVRRQAAVDADGFLEAAARIGRARREVEGRDG